MALTENLDPTAQGFYNNHTGPSGGAASKAAALADKFDTTFNTQDLPGGYDTYVMSDPTAGPDAVVASVIVWLRIRLQAASTNGAQLRIRSGGVDVTSASINLDNAGGAVIREVSYDVTALKPGGGVWTVPDLAALEAGHKCATGSGATLPDFIKMWVALVTEPVPVRLSSVRRAISARLLRYSRTRNRIVVPSSPEQLGVDLVTDMRFADRRGPTPAGTGWRLDGTNPRLGRVAAIEESLDPREIDVSLEAEDLRYQLVQLLDGGRSSEAPSALLDGVAMLDTGDAIVRTFARSSRVLVPSPVDLRITALPNDVEGVGHRGRFIEGAVEQKVKDSVFRAGFGAWTTSGANVTLDTTETIFSPEVTLQHAKLAGTNEWINQSGIPAPSGWIWISVDHREESAGDVTQIRVQRASDSQYWNGSAWQGGSIFLDLAASLVWIRSNVGPIDQTAGATTYTIRLQTKAADVSHVYCVQQEPALAGKGWVSSRIDTETALYTRAVASLAMSGEIWPDDRGSYLGIATPEWDSINLVGASPFRVLRLQRDASNIWTLEYDPTSHPGRWRFTKRVAGANHSIELVTALNAGQDYRWGVTWQGTDLENGDQPHQLKLVVDGVEVKGVAAAFGGGLARGTLYRGSTDTTTGQWNGFIQNEKLSPFVYTREEIVRLLS